MTVVVTGGAGFIGGHLAESFVRDDRDVVVVDNFDPYYATGIKEHTARVCRDAADASRGSYSLIRGSVTDEALVEEVIADAEFVFHEAAQAGVRTSVEDPKKPNRVNVTGTLNVLEAARESGVERVVVASSSSVYGKPEYLPYDEEHPTTPVSPYGVSKLAAEQYTRVYHEVYGLPTVSLRYFTVYGPRMRPNMAISNFVSRCLNGKPPVVYGDGSQTRDFTYITDVIGANKALFETDRADGTVLNIGSTSTITIRELAERVRDQLAPELSLSFGDRHEADAEHTHADVSRASELLGYDPSVPIGAGIEKFIEWYAANRDWYEPLVLDS